MSNLDDLIATAGPDLAAHANPNPGPDRFPLPDADDRAFVLEAVYEAYLLHYGEPRAFVGMDADLRLLAGDVLYAQGLARLAEREDTDAVAELADLISLCAWAESAERHDVVEALWDASARRLLEETGPGARREVAERLAQDRP
jgi:hypothetical protein